VKKNIGNVEHDCKWEQGKKRRNKLDLKKEQNYSLLGTKVLIQRNKKHDYERNKCYCKGTNQNLQGTKL
jgi:hypothetical protein